MGCDIHMYSEAKINDKWTSLDGPLETEDEHTENAWVQISRPLLYRNRNYWFFGLLAGVRTEYSYSFQPRGLPADASPETKACSVQWDGDAHTHSYLDMDELVQKRTALLLEGSDAHIANHIINLTEIINAFKGVDGDDHRIVFWFDN
jgi:hypothetical protein